MPNSHIYLIFQLTAVLPSFVFSRTYYITATQNITGQTPEHFGLGRQSLIRERFALIFPFSARLSLCT